MNKEKFVLIELIKSIILFIAFAFMTSIIIDLTIKQGTFFQQPELYIPLYITLLIAYVVLILAMILLDVYKEITGHSYFKDKASGMGYWEGIRFHRSIDDRKLALVAMRRPYSGFKEWSYDHA